MQLTIYIRTIFLGIHGFVRYPGRRETNSLPLFSLFIFSMTTFLQAQATTREASSCYRHPGRSETDKPVLCIVRAAAVSLQVPYRAHPTIAYNYWYRVCYCTFHGLRQKHETVAAQPIDNACQSQTTACGEDPPPLPYTSYSIGTEERATYVYFLKRSTMLLLVFSSLSYKGYNLMQRVQLPNACPSCAAIAFM